MTSDKRDGVEAIRHAESGDRRLEERTPIRLPRFKRRTRTGPVALSSSQRLLVGSDRAATSENWIPILWRMDGDLNVEAFVEAWQGLLEQHEILRTRIYREEQSWRQDVMPASAGGLEQIDLGDMTLSEGELSINSRLKAFLASPPSLDGGVTYVALYRLSPGTHIVAGFIHHIALDARGVHLIRREVGRRYFGALGKERERQAPEVPAVQFADFAAWENTWLSEEARASVLDVWRRELAQARAVQLPWGRRRGDGPDTPELAVFDLRSPVHSLIVQTARRHGVTVNILFLASVALVLGRASNMKQATFVTHVSARLPGHDDVIGCFSQMRPFHLSFEDDPSFAKLLSRARRAFSRTMDIRRPASLEFLDRHGIGNVVVNVQGSASDSARPRGERAQDGTSFWPPTPSGLAGDASEIAGTGKLPPGDALQAYTPRIAERLVDEFYRDLHISATHDVTGLRALVTYGKERASRAQIEGLCRDLSLMHAVACSAPHQPVSELLDVVQN